MATIRLASRRPAIRCVICHDGLEDDLACPECGAPFHRECCGPGEQCPTLGCMAVVPSVPARRLRLVVGLAVGVVLGTLGLLVLGGGTIPDEARSRPGSPDDRTVIGDPAIPAGDERWVLDMRTNRWEIERHEPGFVCGGCRALFPDTEREGPAVRRGCWAPRPGP